jgi:hypothetical protein
MLKFVILEKLRSWGSKTFKKLTNIYKISINSKLKKIKMMKKSKIYRYKFMEKEMNLKTVTNSTEIQCSKIFKDSHN